MNKLFLERVHIRNGENTLERENIDKHCKENIKTLKQRRQPSQ